ncbi:MULTISPECIES: transposase [Bacillaceae]|uniref:transposase n=1 Tax=Bacillaceae TaxID=186817 RepID=UPI001F1E6312|nr:transposase [Litchfieldia alkalitelluris]
MSQKRYSQEYKEYVVKLVLEEGRKTTELAYELEISPKSVSRWVREAREELRSKSEGEEYVTPKELKKIKAEYEKQLREKEEENEILKKAMHIFTRNQE